MSVTLPATEAVLNYLVPPARKPARYTYTPPGGVPDDAAGRPDPHRVAIRDARKLALAARLDVEGFALVPHPTAVRDFLDEAEVRSIYYAELESLVLGVTGAEKVVIFDHTLRTAAEQRSKGVREPVRFVHNDYTLKSGPQRVLDLLPRAEAESRLRARYAVVNVWRPIKRPVEATPLAVADARSIRLDDFLATDLVYPDRVGEVYLTRWNPAHRWYFYSGMRRDEALLIKTYDSLEDGTARFSAHSAFDDPNTRPDAPPRESIEARALVFFR